MDEVKAMTQAGETVGKAVGTGLRTLRLGAVQAGQAGAEAAARAAAVAEQRLTESAETVRDTAANTQTEFVKTTRRARKKLAKRAKAKSKELKSTGKDLRKTAKKSAQQAREQAKGNADDLRGRAAKKAAKARASAGDLVAGGKQSRKGRRWPWVLGLGVAAAGTVYVLKSRQQAELSEPAPFEDRPDVNRISTNGSTPPPRQEQHDSQVDQRSN
jgi:hypothetical protein